MNELKLTEALLDDQRAVSDTLRQQLEDVRRERDAVMTECDRLVKLIRDVRSLNTDRFIEKTIAARFLYAEEIYKVV